MLNLKFRADGELQPRFASRPMRTHHTRKRAIIGDRQRGVTQGMRVHHQRLRMLLTAVWVIRVLRL